MATSINQNQYDTLVEAITELKKRGYDKELNVTPVGVQESGSDIVFTPEDVIIEEYHRFEGDSNPGDMAVVYAVKGPKNTKGVIIDAYGTYSDESVNEVIKRLKMKKGLT